MPPRGGAKTAEAIRLTAIEMFNANGYQATTLRDLASVVGLKVGSLYNHIASKEDLLFSIMTTVMNDLVAAMDEALAPWDQPSDRLRAAVECHIGFHAERAQEVFIGNSELRSLPDDRRAEVVALRDAYEATIRQIIEDGIAAGEFFYSDARLATYAILAIGTHVSSWYQPGGRLTLSRVASGYSDLLLRALRNPERQVVFGEVLTVADGA